MEVIRASDLQTGSGEDDSGVVAKVFFYQFNNNNFFARSSSYLHRRSWIDPLKVAFGGEMMVCS